MFCLDRWRQLRSQAITEISGSLLPAFRGSLFTKRKINIYSRDLSSFLRRAQMCLEVIWRRSLHAHLLSQQMLLQSYRLVNQENVLLFPDLVFLCRIKHITNPLQGKGKYRENGMCSQIPAFYLFIEQMVSGPTWAYVDCFAGKDKCAVKQAWPETDWWHCNLFLIQMKFQYGESGGICYVAWGKKLQKRSWTVSKLCKQTGIFQVWIRGTFLQGHDSLHAENTSARYISLV